jgi:ABC-type multidrug transport system fused ATPase/permease subunit
MINEIRKINFLLNKRQKTSLSLLFILVFIGLLLEIISLASIIPLIDVVLKQNTESSNLLIVRWFYSFFSIEIDFSKFIILLVLFIFLVKIFYFFILTFKQNAFLANLNSKIGSQLFLKYLSNNYSFFISSSNSYLVKNLQVEVSYFNAYCLNLLTFVVESLLVISILFTLLYVEPFYTLILGFFLSLIIFIIVFISKKRVAYYGLKREAIDTKLAKISTDAFGAIKTIILANRINFFSKIYSDYNLQRAKYVSSQNNLIQLPKHFIEFIVIIGLLAFLFITENSTQNNLNIISTLALFITALFRLMPSLNKILASYQSFKFYDPSVSTIFNEMSKVTELNFLSNQEATSPVAYIVVNNITFSHNEKLIFKDLKLIFEINDSIGIIGPSGSGKSTFVDVFMGLLTPTKGDILYQKKSIYSNLTLWHSIIGYVPQQTYLINDSIKNNIAFGMPDQKINLKRLNQVIIDSGLEVFIKNSENGLDQIVGDKGSFLSGGEIQRIGLARALYNSPKILILDEPTSALDKKMTNKIMKTISDLLGKLTIILITHDPSLLDQFNKIYQLENNIFKVVKGK